MNYTYIRGFIISCLPVWNICSLTFKMKEDRDLFLFPATPLVAVS